MALLFGGNFIKDIEDATKTNKLAAKVTKIAAPTAMSYKGNQFSPYYLMMPRSHRIQGVMIPISTAFLGLWLLTGTLP